MKKIILTFTLIGTGTFLLAQNVGIGTSLPAYKLDVVGSINCSSNAYFGGTLLLSDNFNTRQLAQNK